MSDRGRWAGCGAMHLTGDPGGPPLLPPNCAGPAVDGALARFGLDACVLGERAALLDLRRAGVRSCGGSSMLLPAADGWVVVSLARDDDVASVPAVFELDDGPGCAATWEVVAREVVVRPATEVAERLRALGVPGGRVGEPCAPFAVRGAARPSGGRPRPIPAPFVVDLSALWAGPLAAGCLGRLWGEVVKVEDLRRPDGARLGHAGFFDLLNQAKRSVALDLGTADGRSALDRLVARADVVVTSSRHRALTQLGLDPERFLASGSDKVWVAITGHGWDDDRVGFGDDAAASAGLVGWHPDDGRPRFAADAVADPIAGALAAHAAAEAWERGGRWFVDASLAGAAASVRGEEGGPAIAAEGTEDGWALPDGTPVMPPSSRTAGGRARPLGADTTAVLAELGG